MKNLFEPDTVAEVVSRIDKLTPASQRQWGKMDVAQMMAHCSITMDIASGNLNLPRIFIGRLIAPFLKSIYTNEKPFAKNGPTAKSLSSPVSGISRASANNSKRSSGTSMRAEKAVARGIPTPSSAL